MILRRKLALLSTIAYNNRLPKQLALSLLYFCHFTSSSVIDRWIWIVLFDGIGWVSMLESSNPYLGLFEYWIGLLSKMAEFWTPLQKISFFKYFCKIAKLINFEFKFVSLNIYFVRKTPYKN